MALDRVGVRGDLIGPGATAADYTDAARAALDDERFALAFEQIAAALSFDPLDLPRLGLLETILARSKKPLRHLPASGDVFFGLAAVRACGLAREGSMGAAVGGLLQVVAFRPTVPYLAWLDRWLDGPSGVRGVGVDDVLAGVAHFLRSSDAAGREPGVRVNLGAAERLLERLVRDRPRSTSRVPVLRSILLRRLDRPEEARDWLRAQRSHAGSRDVWLELAAAERGLGDLEAARVWLEKAVAAVPTDTAAKLDRADLLLEMGLFESARAAYHDLLDVGLEGSSRDRVEALDAYASVLFSPSERGGWVRVAGLTTGWGKAVRDDLLSVTETAIWLDDPVAHVVRSAVARAAERPPSDRGRVVVRVRLLDPPPRSAYLALAAGLRALDLEGDLLATVDDGVSPARDVEAPSASSPVDHAALERVRDLSSTAIDLEAWCAGPGAGLSPSAADPILDGAIGMPRGTDPVAWLQRARMAAMCLVARASSEPATGAKPGAELAWLSDLAHAADDWLSAAAIAVLSALSRARPSVAPLVVEVLSKLVESDRSDARRETLGRAVSTLPEADAAMRRQAFSMRAIGTRPPRLTPTI